MIRNTIRSLAAVAAAGALVAVASPADARPFGTGCSYKVQTGVCLHVPSGSRPGPSPSRTTPGTVCAYPSSWRAEICANGPVYTVRQERSLAVQWVRSQHGTVHVDIRGGLVWRYLAATGVLAGVR
jgi:hypothetical protein